MFWIMTVSAVILSQPFELLSYGQASQIKASSEIDRIYLEDQQARQPPNPSAPKPVYKSDDEREIATRKLLENGNLKSGKDFEEAAVVFQHSHQSDDYLLAHTLAMVAVSKGNKDAIWIASASLDRYLMAIGKPQIYGTQFMTPAGQHATQEPYNRQLISDQLRKELQVPSQAEQEVRRKGFDTP
jgi:hypothetical protein